MKVLVTGAAGFIGFHKCKSLCENGYEVIGIDNLNDYYDVTLKLDRLNQLAIYSNFEFIKMDIANKNDLSDLFHKKCFQRVIHLAAQAGVRYSIQNPYSYIESNILGFMNVLECCRNYEIEHLVYASSSSVYGANEKVPFSEKDNVDHPVSLYAASKKSNELMAHSYSHLYGLPTTGLRFFTVYGPWGRPDMSPVLFSQLIKDKKPIKVFNYGRHQRDFTYIDDIVNGIHLVMDCIPTSNSDWDGHHPDASSSRAPWRIYNIGNSKPVELLYFIECIENELGIKAEKILLPMQMGDVENTFADVSTLSNRVGYEPKTPINIGVKKFIEWFVSYYR